MVTHSQEDISIVNVRAAVKPTPQRFHFLVPNNHANQPLVVSLPSPR